MSSEMQDTPPEPSLAVVFCNKTPKVQMKKKPTYSSLQICNFLVIAWKTFYIAKVSFNNGGICQNRCTILMHGVFHFMLLS